MSKATKSKRSFWHQTSPWYERVALSMTTLGGVALAFFLPVRMLLAPADVFGIAPFAAIAIAVFLLVVGTIVAVPSGILLARSRRSPSLVLTHLQGLAAFSVILCFVTGVSYHVYRQMEAGLRMTAKIEAFHTQVKADAAASGMSVSSTRK